MGALNLRNKTEPGRVIVRTKRAFPHPRYMPSVARNDIALIRLMEEAVEFSDTIKAIELPFKSPILENDSPMTAIGFGLQNTSDTSLAPVLQRDIET